METKAKRQEFPVLGEAEVAVWSIKRNGRRKLTKFKEA